MSDNIISRIQQLVSSVKAIDFNDILEDVYSRKDVQDNIIFLNTENQLRLGINTEGGVVGLYRDILYSFLKQSIPGRKAGLGIVDLFLTGDYYESFLVKVTSDSFIIDSDPIKDDKNLIQIYGNIEGLTDDSLKKHFIFIIPIINNELRKAILR